MNIARLIGYTVGVVLLASCGTVEQNSWTFGIPRKDAMEISQAMRVSLGIHKIYTFRRLEDGGISVSTDLGIYTAHRVGRTWKFTKEIVVVDHTMGLTRRWSQPLAVAMGASDFMKQFSMFATLAAASGGSALSR